MYLEKHMEFVKFLTTMSQMDITQEDANLDLLRPLGIHVPTVEGDKNKWQCGVVGCDFKDTLQHLYTHLQKKEHIDLPMFSCQYWCVSSIKDSLYILISP
jgi:iron-sulfur cluster repair protein YtfE (RIC family)